MSNHYPDVHKVKFSIWRVIIGVITWSIYSYFNLTGSAVAANLYSYSNLSEGNRLTMVSPDPQATQLKISDLIKRQARAWETADSDQIIADFAEDGVFIVPGSQFRGKQQIKAAVDDYFSQVAETQIRIDTIIVQENKGAVEWTWCQRNKETGQLSKTEDAIIFELDQGKIKSWREYMDNKSQ